MNAEISTSNRLSELYIFIALFSHQRCAILKPGLHTSGHMNLMGEKMTPAFHRGVYSSCIIVQILR
uniref:Uncharacterized protein n=1 Tax=Anguilla anguilla TaxID=7936 RepID=A0A0E9QLJ7_ANGAN